MVLLFWMLPIFIGRRFFKTRKKATPRFDPSIYRKSSALSTEPFRRKRRKTSKKVDFQRKRFYFSLFIMRNFDLFSPFSYVKSWFGALKICSAGKDYQRLYATVKSKKSKKFSRKGGPLKLRYLNLTFIESKKHRLGACLI